MRARTLFLAALLGLIAAAPRPAPAQEPAAPPAADPADPADVADVDAILTALYDVISGPAGEERDWDRLRSLFLPGAHMIPTGLTPEGDHRHFVWSVDDYISNVGPRLVEVGFREREIARRMEQYGNIAHAWSTYEGTTEQNPDAPMRGINSIQLMNDGERWWVVNIFWEGERPDNPIPEEYLP